MELNKQDIIECIEQKNIKKFKELVIDCNYIDIAEIIEELDDKQKLVVFRMLPKDIAADVFSYLSFDNQEEIISHITEKEINEIIEDLFTDDAVDLLDELPSSMVKKILSNAKSETRNTLNQFLKYKDNSAGSIMTSEYIDLRANYNVKECIETIRKVGQDKENIYTCYVIDEARKLIGVISAKQLLLSNEDVIVKDIMVENFVYCNTNDDQEEVSKLLQKYDLIALPVVDNESRLVGIITIDDAVDVISEETEEDFEKMAAILPSDKPYFDMSVWSLFKNRILWLGILMITGIFTGAILQSFESSISTLPLLVSFLPMINDTGGNSGSQAATMCIRGLTTGEIKPSQWLKTWWKEFRVSLLISTTLAIFNFARIMLLQFDEPFEMRLKYAIVVCSTLILTVIIAKSIGALLPLLAKKIKLDPAVCAAPMITTIVDCCAILIYFGFANLVFQQML